jgi:hypothetical protein
MAGRILSCALLSVLTILAATTSSAQAVRETAKRDDSYVFTFVNPCSGEPLVLQTEVQTFTRLVTDGSGGTHLHFNGRWKYRAVSQATGIEYLGNETGNWSIFRSSGGTYNETYVSRGQVVARGPAENLNIHTFMKVTVTPDGKVATAMEYQTVDCRG